MATNTFNSTYSNHHHTLRRRRSIDCPPTTFSLRPTATAASVSSLSFAAASATYSTPTSTTTASTSEKDISFDLIRQHLSAKNFRQADEETRRLLIVLAGEAAQKRGYVFFSEVQFIAEEDLKTIDQLWKQYSDNKFGFSVQKQIWKKADEDFTKFFIKVGWMKKLEGCEVEQYNYKAFPNEFMWEMEEGTPEGHLPLTNALRGTQLLNCILNHPAFAEVDGGENGGVSEGGERKNSGSTKPLGKTFKPTYTF